MEARLINRVAGPVRVLFVLALAAAPCPGADWPHWRGPDGNSISPETDWSPAALNAQPRVVWETNVGKGYSCPSIKGERLYTMGNRKNQDIVSCLDVATGDLVWECAYECQADSYPGPRATPAVDGDMLYTVSRAGHVFCLDAAAGTVKWQANITTDQGAKPPRWGHATSAVVMGELLLLNGTVSGIALDKTTGAQRWAGAKGLGGYSTPVVVDRPGRKTAVFFGETDVFEVDAATGRRLWSHPWETKYHINAADPIVLGDRVFISSGYGNGAALLDVAGGEPKVLWKNEKMGNQFSTSIAIDGHIYGVDGNTGGGTLRCLALATGEETWSVELGFGALIAADGKLIFLNEKGSLFVAAADPTAYKELARADAVLKPTCWTMPVLCRGRLYCRNEKGDLVCLDARTASPAPQP